MMLIVRL